MAGKKILIILVMVAAAVTGYVLVRDAKTNLNNPQEMGKAQGVQKAAEKAATAAVADKSSVSDAAKVSQPAATQPASQPAAASSSSEQVNNSNNKKIMELAIKTTKEGTGERVVKSGDKISMLYIGKFLDGTVFDSSEKHGGKPLPLTIGTGAVIKGWDQGILGMKLGEKRTLMIPSDLGYGAQGAGASIPPNTDLIFDVELVSFN